MKWEAGRQGTGYEKLCLVRLGKLLDAYLLKYHKGSFIPPHRDPVDDRKHYRINIEVRKAEKGGIFYGKAILHFGRIVFFRPDIDTHGVTEIKDGKRLVFSVGFTRKKK